jgi:tetratricopeptide (TPR) repeat protein
VLVLQGPSGVGKSMIAHHIAVAADMGCGWILNATDAEALRKSLAKAQAGEQSAQAELADSVAMRALASEALRRLNRSEAPWVVVLDNCDGPPDEPGLRSLMPIPRRNGQILIVTTVHDQWRDHAQREGWRYFEVPRLEQADLDDLAIPAELRPVVDGRPLIAQVLTAVESHIGRMTKPTTAGTGPALAWELILKVLAADPAALHLARVLAWCPPDPVPFASALESLAGTAAIARPLVDFRFVNLTQADGAPALQMHREFGQAVRHQVWDDDPATARQVVETLIADPAGRELFISASDSSALRHLETDDAERTVECLAPDAAGLLWYGLGTVREQRGPVAASRTYFEKALELLDPNEHRYECAEILVGLARVTFQGAGRSAGDAEEAVEEQTSAARQLLLNLTDKRARQLSERANALSLLIKRTAVEHNPDREVRRVELPQIIEGLWLSYEQRVRIARGLPDTAPVARQAPAAELGLDADRAYFNLAGAYLALALTYDADSAGLRDNLERAGAIYTDCRRLREERYAGRLHPHLAACINGEGLVAYYQGIKLGDKRQRLFDAIQQVGAALAQRQEIASGLVGGDQAAILGEVDVRKSTALVMKAILAVMMGSYPGRSGGIKVVQDTFEQTIRELPDDF